MKLWKGISFLLLSYSILRLPWFQVDPAISSLFLVVALMLILYISLPIPSGLLITDKQITRMYDRSIELEEMSKGNIIEHYDNEQLLEYLFLIYNQIHNTE